MCFVLEWCLGFFASAMQPWLAWNDFVTLSTLYAKSYRRLQNPIDVCVALYILMYSAFVLDIATVG